jgi:hypothetical protein
MLLAHASHRGRLGVLVGSQSSLRTQTLNPWDQQYAEASIILFHFITIVIIYLEVTDGVWRACGLGHFV